MDLQTVSTKQLREELPEIKELLLAGQSFYWLDRSKVVGIISPPKANGFHSTILGQDYQSLVQKVVGGIKTKKKYTAEDVNKLIDSEYDE